MELRMKLKMELKSSKGARERAQEGAQERAQGSNCRQAIRRHSVVAMPWRDLFDIRMLDIRTLLV